MQIAYFKDGVCTTVMSGGVPTEYDSSISVTDEDALRIQNGATIAEDGIITDVAADESTHYHVYDKIIDNNLKKNQTIAPTDLDYGVLGLKKERIFDKGELKTIKFWKEYDEVTSTYSDLTVQEDNLYTRNVDGFIEKREKTIKWFKKDGGASADKTTQKYYNTLEATVADDRARSYILSKIKIDCIGLIAATTGLTNEASKVAGLPFVTELSNEMTQFRDGNRQPLIDKVTNYDTVGGTIYGWLDNDTGISDGIGGTLTIREYVVYSATP